MLTPQVHGSRGELERWRLSVRVTAWGPRRTAKSGAGRLDPDSATGVAGFSLWFVEGTGLEPGSPHSPKFGSLLIKTFPFPTNFCMMLVFGSSVW